MSDSIAVNTFTMLCNHHLSLVPKHFYHNKIKLYTHWVVIPYCSLPPAPGYHQSASCLYGFTHSCQRNHILCGLSHQVYFIYHNGLEILPQCSMFQHFVPFSWLNNIPPYGSTTFCLSIHLLMSLWGCFYYCEQSCYEHVCTSICLSLWDSFVWVRFYS